MCLKRVTQKENNKKHVDIGIDDRYQIKELDEEVDVEQLDNAIRQLQVRLCNYFETKLLEIGSEENECLNIPKKEIYKTLALITLIKKRKLVASYEKGNKDQDSDTCSYNKENNKDSSDISSNSNTENFINDSHIDLEKKTSNNQIVLQKECESKEAIKSDQDIGKTSKEESKPPFKTKGFQVKTVIKLKGKTISI